MGGPEQDLILVPHEETALGGLCMDGLDKWALGRFERELGCYVQTWLASGDNAEARSP